MELLYTDTAQIRSALLLSEEDLPDLLFNQEMYERDLMLHLAGWLPDHLSVMQDSSSPQVAQALISYCTYWCAAKVAQTLVVSLPQQVGDGKNTIQRYPDLEALVPAMMGGMAEARQAVLSGLGLLASAATRQVTLFGVAGLAVDPVTG